MGQQLHHLWQRHLGSWLKLKPTMPGGHWLPKPCMHMMGGCALAAAAGHGSKNQDPGAGVWPRSAAEIPDVLKIWTDIHKAGAGICIWLLRVALLAQADCMHALHGQHARRLTL